MADFLLALGMLVTGSINTVRGWICLSVGVCLFVCPLSVCLPSPTTAPRAPLRVACLCGWVVGVLLLSVCLLLVPLHPPTPSPHVSTTPGPGPHPRTPPSSPSSSTMTWTFAPCWMIRSRVPRVACHVKLRPKSKFRVVIRKTSCLAVRTSFSSHISAETGIDSDTNSSNRRAWIAMFLQSYFVRIRSIFATFILKQAALP